LKQVTNYINSRKAQYVEELKDFLRIPSISTLADHKKEMHNAANFVASKLKDAGIENVKLIQTKGHPLVYGDWLYAKNKPTVLIYGHYDVQPVDPINLWDSPPFEPIIKGNKIYARGATDDKGQMYVHIKSVEAFFKTIGKLPVNVKFIIEGEEEIGSQNLEEFVNKNADILKCDAILISDTSLFGPGIPTLTYGLRGLSYLQIEVTGPDRDLHSGTFGGAVDNPINVLAEMISKLKNKDGKITIPGFYDDVVKLTKKERDNFKALPFSAKQFARSIGVRELKGEKGYTTYEHTWARPSLDCNGILGGFTGDGAKTVLPSKAMAKVSMRLVPDQNPKKIAKLFKAHIKNIAPKTVEVKVNDLHGAYPIVSPLDAKATVSAAEALSKVFGKKTVFMREGGSIPIVVVFSQKLKAPVVMMGIGLNSENLHSPNEHFNLTHFHLGILSSAHFLDIYSK
jgi:acetylornithine deacetylase/succinyl-diaminopimelate desuccinylase-like protein